MDSTFFGAYLNMAFKIDTIHDFTGERVSSFNISKKYVMKLLGWNKENINISYSLFDTISDGINLNKTDLSIEVTPSEIADRRTQIIASLGGESKLPAALVGANLAASDLDTNLKTLIISERMQSNFINSGGLETEYFAYLQDLIVKTAKKLGVKVNPKYGKWNSETASIDASDSTDGAVTGLP